MNESNITKQFLGFLTTPDIFSSGENTGIKTFEFPEVEITQALLEDLHQLAHPRNSVLGKRMESFFEIAMKHSARYEVISSNIQIISEKRTLGELDFILFDHIEKKPLHVELVYKLYLYDEKLSGEKEKWIGPNRRDSFPQKLQKLQERQFPLLYHSKTMAYLNNIGIRPEELEQQLCFKAQLYLHESSPFKKQFIVNEKCIHGHWCSFNEFLSKPWEDNLFFTPRKQDWSCDPKSNEQWISRRELMPLLEQVLHQNKAQLVWMKQGHLIQRFFIVWW